jgi:hypothetical protein
VGEREEALEQPVGLLEPLAQLGVERVELRREGAGLAGGDVERGAHHRQWRAQLVRGVGDEAALRVEGGFEPCQEPVDRVGEILQLITRALQGEPLVQVVLRNAPRRRGDLSQRPQHAAGDEPAEPDRDERHDRQRDPGLEQQLVELGRVLAVGCILELLSLGLELFRGGEAVGALAAPGRSREDGSACGAADEHVGDREQDAARDQKQAAIEERKPQADARPRQMPPGAELA